MILPPAIVCINTKTASIFVPNASISVWRSPIILTFLATILKHPAFVSTLEHFVPWGRARHLLCHSPPAASHFGLLVSRESRGPDQQIMKIYEGFPWTSHMSSPHLIETSSRLRQEQQIIKSTDRTNPYALRCHSQLGPIPPVDALRSPLRGTSIAERIIPFDSCSRTLAPTEYQALVI